MAYLRFYILSAVHKLKIRVRAIKDAAVSYNGVEDLIVAILGPRPKPFSPTEVDRHRILQHDRTNVAKAEELTNDVHRKEEEHKHKWNPRLMWFFVGVLYFIELCGSADVFRKAGVDGGTVLVYAAMLTTAMFVIANAGARQAPRTARYYGWHAGFFAIGIAAAIVRYHEALALAAIMFAITVLPAWLAEVFIKNALEGRETARALALTRRELRNEQKTIKDAHAEGHAINERVANYDHLAGLIRAEYRRHWEYERRRLETGRPLDTDGPDVAA
jgi:hypothetical protein